MLLFSHSITLQWYQTATVTRQKWSYLFRFRRQHRFSCTQSSSYSQKLGDTDRDEGTFTEHINVRLFIDVFGNDPKCLLCTGNLTYKSFVNEIAVT